MKYDFLICVDPAMLASEESVRNFARGKDIELEDEGEVDTQWRIDGDPAFRFYGGDEFLCANVLMSGEGWPDRAPECLPFLGGTLIELHEGVAAMVKGPDLVRTTYDYLRLLDLDGLMSSNSRFFDEQPWLPVKEQVLLGSRVVESLIDFYEGATIEEKAVISVGCVV